MNCAFRRDHNEQRENVQVNNSINKRQACYANKF